MNKALKLAAVLMAAMSLMWTGAADSRAANEPDFAMPRQVEAKSRKALDKALAGGDGPAALRALADLALAQAAVNPDSLGPALGAIADARRRMPEATFSAMTCLLQAHFLANAYEANAFAYNRRTLPLQPRPADYRLWSGEQFRQAVELLLDSALMHPGPLARTPLRAYSECITPTDKWQQALWPTLLDFMATRAAAIEQRMGSSRAVKMRALSYEKLRLAQAAKGSGPWVESSLRCLDLESLNDERLQQKRLRELLAEAGSDNIWSGLVLERLSADGGDDARRLHGELTAYLKRFPDGPTSGCLRNTLAGLEQPRVAVSAPLTVPPGKPVAIDVTMANTSTGQLCVYKVDNPEPGSGWWRFDPTAPPRLVASIDLGSPRALPWEADTTVSVIFPEAGFYALLPIAETTEKVKGRSLTLVNATELALAAGGADGCDLWSLSPADGRPLGGATVMQRGRKGMEQIGITDDRGSLRLKADGSWHTYIATLGASTSGELSCAAGRGDTDDNESIRASINTALPLCRPGDTMGWMAVAWRSTLQGCEPLEDRELTATLFDANGQQAATATATTDRFGRVEGSFDIPSDGSLQGSYRIMLSTADSRLAIGNTYFKVSDYKLPTFEITDFKTLSDTPARGAVTISGRALTYSGFPLADAPVELTLESAPAAWWRYSEAPEAFWTSADGLATDADGCFKTVVPAAAMALAPWPEGRFTAQVKVTSPTLESAFAATRFARTNPLRLSVMLPQALNADTPEAELTAISGDGTRQPGLRVEWQALDEDGDTPVARGFTVTGPDASLNLKDVPSGQRRFRFRLADWRRLQAGDELDLASEGWQEARTVVYRPGQTDSPVEEPLWTPDTTIETQGETATTTVWAAWPVWVRYALQAEGRLIEEKWLELPAGRNEITATLPRGLAKARLTLAGMANYRNSSITLDVENPALLPGLKIEAEAFRDKTVPGAGERWRFKVKANPGERPAAAAMALTLYNAALEAITPLSWTLQPQPLQRLAWSWQPVNLPGGVWERDDREIRWDDCNNVSSPTLQLWGRDSYSDHYFMGANTRMMKSMKPRAVMTDMADSMSYEAVEEAAVAMTQGEAEQEADGGDTDAGDTGEKPFAYRDREVALALFRPALESGRDGTVAVSFTMPDANTTWLLKALAWDERMQTAGFNASVVASKPLMVQPGLPRFVRSGDRCLVEALVINADSVATTAEVAIEVALPGENGRVLQAKATRLQLEGATSATVAMEFDVPTEGTDLIIYRIKASNGTFADGEQAPLPVLPASQPVVESRIVWFMPGQKVTDIEIDDTGLSDARVTLDVMENTVWSVVAALPGLQADGLLTAPDAARALFSVATAEGLLRTRPAIAKALRRWISTPEASRDSSLVASLCANPELKTLMLQATPWVGAAQSDAERLTRLALLFDRRAVDSARERAIAALAGLNRADGGWGWNNGDSDWSQWATMQTMLTLGRLNQLGWLPTDSRLKRMTEQALKRIDAAVAEEYRKRPQSNFTVYTRMRQMWPDSRQSTAAAAVTSATVQQLTGRWADLPIGPKALAAIILENANYHATARTILESLREYAETSAEKGMWWPTLRDYNSCATSLGEIGTTALCLEAFAGTEPGCADIDMIRQWLITQKLSQDWGSGADAAAAVTAVLSTSEKWEEPARGLEIEIDGQPVEQTSLAAINRTAGQWRLNLEGAGTGTHIRIARSTDAPGVAALYMQGQASMSEAIEGACTDGLRIDKQLLLMEGGEACELPATAPAGARVRVELTVHCDQTLDYVAISDERAACLEPVEQLPATVVQDGLVMRRENLDASTLLFIRRLPAGVWRIHYDCTLANAGEYAGGVATLQSQYAPMFTAHSGSEPLTVGR